MKKIMIVDDVEISNFIMKKMIARIEGEYDLYDYTYPAKAINTLNEINPDIIFLDINMPEINGWQFLEIMKEKNFTNDVYILTSSTSELDLKRSRDFENVKNFLVKPINLQALAGILQSDTYAAETT